MDTELEKILEDVEEIMEEDEASLPHLSLFQDIEEWVFCRCNIVRSDIVVILKYPPTIEDKIQIQVFAVNYDRTLTTVPRKHLFESRNRNTLEVLTDREERILKEETAKHYMEQLMQSINRIPGRYRKIGRIEMEKYWETEGEMMAYRFIGDLVPRDKMNKTKNIGYESDNE